MAATEQTRARAVTQRARASGACRSSMVVEVTGGCIRAAFAPRQCRQPFQQDWICRNLDALGCTQPVERFVEGLGLRQFAAGSEPVRAWVAARLRGPGLVDFRVREPRAAL